MKNVVILSFLLLSIYHLSAQDRPVFLPEDVESNTLQLKCLCKPGVSNQSRSRGLEISFLHVMRSSLQQEDDFQLTPPLSELTLQNLVFNLRFPVVNKEGFKVIGGAFYRPEHFDFQLIGTDYQNVFRALDGRSLKSSGFEGLVTKSWNEKHYSTVRFRVLFNGDYKGVIDFSNQYAIYNFTGIYGVKKDASKEWGIGLNFSQSFRTTLVLPFFLYNQTFNEKWGLEMVLPALINLRHNISPQSILLLGVRYNSRSYSITVDDTLPQIYNLNHSEARLALSLEQQLQPWIWLDATAGIQHNFSTDFDAENNGASSFQVEPGHAPFFKIGIFISPPDSFLK